MEIERLKSIVESLLFLSGDPIKISKVSKMSGVSEPEVENAIMLLQGEYNKRKSGLVIFKKEKEVQMATNPENVEFTKDLIRSEVQEALSKPALEVLSIVAYRGPIARVDIESIRGVNCTFTLRTLLMRGLLERIGNPKDSRGYLYKISMDFLKRLGIDSIDKLPDYEALSTDKRIDNVIEN